MPSKPVECWVVVDAYGVSVAAGPTAKEAWRMWYYIPWGKPPYRECDFRAERDRRIAEGWRCVRVREVSDEQA